MDLDNRRTDGTQDLTKISPQEFSRLLDRTHETEGAEAADALLVQYTRARTAPYHVDNTRSLETAIDGLLTEIGDDPAAESHTSSIAAPINTDMAAAINAEIAAITTTTPAPVSVVEEIANATDDEVARAVEALESRDDAHGAHELDIKLAPGCFGGPLLFKADAKECRQCPFAERCGPVSQERLAALRAKQKDSGQLVKKRTLRPTPDAIETDYESVNQARKRSQARERKRRQRAREADPSAISAPGPSLATPLAPAPAAPSEVARVRQWHKQLIAWTAGSDPRQRKLRGREMEFVKVRAAWERLVHELGREPSHGELADRLGIDRDPARNRRAVLKYLLGPGGPWHAAA